MPRGYKACLRDILEAISKMGKCYCVVALVKRGIFSFVC